MPLYTWIHEDTKEEVTILRPFADYKDPPTKEETAETDSEYDKSKWTKVISPGIKVARGDNWNGSKGNW